MSKKGIIQNVLIIVLGLAIIFMSVGYAAYDRVKITSPEGVEVPLWDVHLENLKKTNSSTITNEKIIDYLKLNEEKTQVTFGVSLVPGDVFEFTIDVINSGKFDGKLNNYFFEEVSGADTTGITYELIGATMDEVLSTGEFSTKTVRITAATNVENTLAKTYSFKLGMYYIPTE